MKKKFMSIACFVLCVALLLGLAACATTGTDTGPAASAATSTQASGTSTAPSADLPHYKIALIAYTNAGAWWERLYNSVKACCDAYNCELIIAFGSGQDECIKAFENVIAAGAQAIINLSDGNLQSRFLEVCNEKGIYYSDTFSDSRFEPGYDQFSTTKAWCGNIAPDVVGVSVKMVNEMLAAGAKKFVIFGLPEGVAKSIDLQTQAAIDTIKAGGGTILGDARTFMFVDAANNLFSQYPDVEAIYSNFGSSTYLTTPIAQAGKAGQVLLNTFDDEGDTAGCFDQKLLTSAADGTNAEVMINWALLYNALSGHKIVTDAGIAPQFDFQLALFHNSQEYNDWLTSSTNGKTPISMDTIGKLLYINNPGVTVKDFESVVQMYAK